MHGLENHCVSFLYYKQSADSSNNHSSCKRKKMHKNTIFVHLLYLDIKGDSDSILSGSICSGTRDKHVGGADLNQMQQNTGRPGLMSEKGVSNDHISVYLHHQGTPVCLSM